MMVAISEIKIRDNWNIRKPSNLDASQLIASIEKVGLQHPIVLNKNYELVAGYRRLHCCKSLGWQEIPATIITYESEMHERIAHIDENILAKSLSEKELELALAEKKRLYMLLYPTASNRGPKQDDDPRSFAKDAAEKTGRSPREINKLTKRVNDVTKEVRQAYEVGKLNSSQIDELARIPKQEQNKIMEKTVGLSVAETKLMIDDYRRKQKSKDLGKSKITDDRNIDIILEAKRITRAIKLADSLMTNFLGGNKFVFLDEECFDELKSSTNSIQETLKVFVNRLSED